MTQRWLGLSIIIMIATSRLASAGISTNPVSPVATAASPVGTQSATVTVTLNNTGTENMDLAVSSTCAVVVGTGTFALSPLTNIPPAGTFTLNYTPSSRGARRCTVNVTNHAGGAALGSFEISGTGLAPVIALSMTPSTSFGTVRELDSAASPTSSRTLVVTNNGDSGQNLSVSGITRSGTNPGEFTVMAGGPAFGTPIAPGNSLSWTIVFNPAFPGGARSASIDVASNDPSTPTASLGVTGTGGYAVIGVGDAPLGTRAYPPLGTALTAITGSSTMTNSTTTNPGPLTASSATIAPTTSGNTWFSFGSGLGCVAGNSSCSLSGAVAPSSIPVQCNPPATASGTETATITVTSDSDTTGDNTGTITCTATRPNISTDKPSGISFGDVNVNSAATAQIVTVTNSGTGPLSFYLTFTGTDAAMFNATVVAGGGCGATIGNQCTVAANGGTAMISVGFTPTSTLGKTATLVINNNDPDSGDNPKNVGLSGNGIAPLIAVTPGTLDIGDVEVGKTSTGTYTITAKNNGTADLTINSAGITTTGTAFAITSGSTGTQGPIAPTASVTWTLTCSPTSQGAKMATFRVSSNSGFGASAVNSDVILKCNGLQGILAIAPTTWNFMGVREGDTVTHDFTLTNTGNVPVNNIAPTLSPTLLGFTVIAYPTSLAGGAGGTVTVQFKPVNDTYGCAVVNSGDCAITFNGNWGVTPTATTPISLVVLGDGLKADYDTYPAYPNALDLGNVRFDKTNTLAVNVINTGGSKINIKGLSISGGSAMTGEFSVASCVHNSVTIACPTMAAPFLTQTAGDTLVVNITCDPNNRIGALDSMLTVTSDLNTATPDRIVPLKCTSTSATMALTPSSMIVDYGPTDLDAVPIAVTQTITLQNMGNADLDVSAATPGGPDLARFGFSTTAGKTLVPGDKLDVVVTYTPNVERPPNTPDTASITFPLKGDLNSPASVTIQLTGYGADRHIGVGMAPLFPDTFKNPGDAAPIMPITIKNTGYAPLNVTGVMLDNDPIWSIENPDPVTIPAASTYDFNIRFAPLMAGKAPTGHFVVMDNDNEAGKAMVAVDLDGTGLARNVAMGPRVIQLGFTGIGIPIRLSELAPNNPLVVENGDMNHGFRIAKIEVDSLGANGIFEIVDKRGKPPVDILLAPGGSAAFDITFSPTEIGDFEATAALYLDQDPDPQATVTLKGRGLYVDAHGGGGCSSGRGSGFGAILLVLGIVLRRRRTGVVVVAGTLALIAGTAGTSQAQSSRNINLNVFEPTPATVATTFHAQSAAVAEDGAWAASALLTYANSPLVLDTSQNDDVAVKNRTMLLLGGAYVFARTFEGSVRLPVLMQSGDPSGDPTMRFGVTPASGAALGDGTIQVKDALGERELLQGTVRYAAGLAFTVPTATGGEFAGNRLPTLHALGMASHTMGRLTSTVNLGGVLRERTTFANIHQGPGIAWAAGSSYRLLDELWVGGELFGDLVPGGLRDMSGSKHLMNTIEGLLGVHYRLARTMELGGALGRGVTDGPGTPALRGLVTFSYLPAAEELKPIHKPRPPEPPKDVDNDGVRDSADDCPMEVEDKDGFRDEDGCPDPDNDNDGINDDTDKCPSQAEDRDHFQDEDGCPDADNDVDGIPDAKDKCPAAPEDKDGFQDGDGCPEPDNDKDGILDDADKCVGEAETINGNADDDGCPDKGDAGVVVSPDRLDLLDSIQFSGTRVTKASSNILGQIGATLRAHPEIVRLRITAHVQPTSNTKSDQKLSEARAKAVRDWLVTWGIDGQRLQTSGFGGEKPLVPPTSKGAQSINDRIELIVLERK